MYQIMFDNETANEGSVALLCDADTMRVAGSLGDEARAQFTIMRVKEEGSMLLAHNTYKEDLA